jgi:6-pyruvoyltetrahydropterin/6-carboxytetrahydropterin synthase
VLIAREFDFQAAHQLPDHPGKCRNLHGHGYRLRVICRAAVDTTTGLAIDFGEVKRIVRERALDALDHAYLNEILKIPSAEHIAAWIWERLEGELPLHEIVLFETPTCYVAYRGEGLDAAARDAPSS